MAACKEVAWRRRAAPDASLRPWRCGVLPLSTCEATYEEIDDGVIGGRFLAGHGRCSCSELRCRHRRGGQGGTKRRGRQRQQRRDGRGLFVDRGHGGFVRQQHDRCGQQRRGRHFGREWNRRWRRHGWEQRTPPTRRSRLSVSSSSKRAHACALLFVEPPLRVRTLAVEIHCLGLCDIVDATAARTRDACCVRCGSGIGGRGGRRQDGAAFHACNRFVMWRGVR